MILLNGSSFAYTMHLVFCCCDINDSRGGKAVLVPCISGKLYHERTSDRCYTCDRSVSSVDAQCHWCAECDELMCEHCHNDVTRNPEYRVKIMKIRCESQPSHWVHNVRGNSEPNSKHLMSRGNNCNRRYVTFDELEENGTKEGTYAYDDWKNLFSDRDRRAKREHESRYHGSGGDGSRGYGGDKRQRRGY